MTIPIPDLHAERSPGGQPRLPDRAVIAVTETLELMAELPSTPGYVAREARELAGDLSERVAAAGQAHEVEVPATALVAAAGMLALCGGMPSTPPAVAEEASAWSAALWSALEEITDEGST